MSQENPHAVFITGNGFDVSCGLPSSYKDFMYVFDDDGRKTGIQPEFARLLNKSKLAQHLDETVTAVNWVDVEQELAAVSMSRKAGSNFKQEFLDLKDALRDYLTRTCDSASPNDCSASRFLQSVAHPYDGYSSVEVLNFNYTRTPAKLVRVSQDNKVLNIHGTSNERDAIVFGVADNAKFVPEHSFLLKGGMRLKAQTTHIDVSQRMAKADLVVIFGHSLGPSDHTLFEPYFSSPTTEHRIIVITHHGNEDPITAQLHQLTGKNFTQFVQRNHLIWADTSKRVSLYADRIIDATKFGFLGESSPDGRPVGGRPADEKSIEDAAVVYNNY